jgi:aspartate aminotransferase
MSSALAARLSVVSPSITLAMNAKAAALRATGTDIISFGVGEPDFEPPRHVLDAAKAAIDRGASKYTAVTGILELRKAIAKNHARRRGGAVVAPTQICVSTGAKHALFNVGLALYEEGDEVIVPAPYWVSYPEQVRMLGATPVVVESSVANGFRMTPEALEKALSPKTKAVIICSPSNPTGSAYNPAQWGALLEVFARSDAWLVIDEIYADLLYDQVFTSPVALRADLRERMIVIDGVSKSYAMTGWRIGWSIAPAAIASAIDMVQGQSTTNASAVSQYAALAALEGPQDEIASMRAAFHTRRGLMVQSLRAIPGITCSMPDGAFYVFADCTGLYGIERKLGPRAGSRIANDEDVAFWLLEEAHVATVPGGPFGAPGYVRFSYATSNDRIREGLARIAAAVQNAKSS